MENKNRRSLDDSLNTESNKYSRSNKENLNTTVTIETIASELLEETTSFEMGGASELAKLGERVDNKRQQLNRLYDEISKSINEEELTYVTIEPDYHNVSPSLLNKSSPVRGKHGVLDATYDSNVNNTTLTTRHDEDEELWNLRKRPPQPLALKLPVAQFDFHAPSSGGQSMLKHVHFDADDIEPPSKQPVAVNKTPSKSGSQTPNRPGTLPFSNKTSPTANTKKTSSSSFKAKTPPVKVATTTPAKVTTAKTTVTAAAKASSSNAAVKLTYEEKRLRAVEEKARVAKTLEILRIKVIRRKFAYIWLRRYFYATKVKQSSNRQRMLLPSQADSYYRHRLLSESFSLWQKDSHMKRNEWRQTIKAVCHYNYVILNKLWKAWQLYTIEHQLEVNLEKRAINHYNWKLKQAAISQWKQMRYELIKKRTSLEVAQKNRNLELAHQCFKHWQMRYFDNKTDGQYYRAACRHYELFHLEQCFKIWSFKFKNEMEERRQVRLAQTHYRRQLLAKCLGSLKIYSAYRRKKNAQKVKINEYAESQLVYKVFHTWSRKYAMVRQVQEMEVHVQEFHERHLKARVFQLWNGQLRLKISLDIRCLKMRRYYEKSLKRKAFEALRSNHAEIQAQREDGQRADLFAMRCLKRRFFDLWADKYDFKVDIKSMHLAYKAKQYYERRIVRKSLAIWIEFHGEQRALNAKLRRADDLHERHVVKRYFDQIRFYTSLTKYKRENHQIATEIYEKNTISKYFAFWCYKYELTLETQMNTRIAILHFESKLKATTYQIWSQKLELRLIEEAKEQKALVYRRKSLMSQMMRTWIKSWRDVKFEMSIEQQALQHDLKRRCQPIFLRWKTRIMENVALDRRCHEVLSQYHIKVKRTIFNAWLKQTHKFKLINSYVNQQFEMKQREKCAGLLNDWRLQVVYKKREKSNEQLAMTFYLKHLMTRIVHEWRAYTRARALKHHVDESRIQEFAKIQRGLASRQIFQVWRRKTRSLVETERKMQLAVSVEQRNLKVKAFIAWRLYVRKCRHQHLLERQAQWFLEMRVKRQVYNVWASKHEETRRLEDKNTRALLFWSINTQRACFSAWFAWHQSKQAKEQRYKEAMQMRRCDIMTNCARHFVVYSMDSKQRRLKASAYLKEKMWTNESELELKYFYIWLGKCKTKKIKRFISEIVDHHEQQEAQESTTSSRKQAVVVQPSLEKREAVMDVNYSKAFIDMKTRSRPAPRKPSYLADSIDIGHHHRTTSPREIVEDKHDSKETTTSVISSGRDRHPEPLPRMSPMASTSTSALLLPPTAFMSRTLDSPRQSTHPSNEQLRLTCPSPSLSARSEAASSVATIAAIELQTELNYVRVETVRHGGLLMSLSPKTQSNLKQISPSGFSTMSSQPAVSTAPNTARKNRESSRDLLELKQRLESLNINSDKLKRLREQEKLMSSVAESNDDANNFSMIGPIFAERDQVRAELEELTRSIKAEKKRVYELMRKHGISPSKS